MSDDSFLFVRINSITHIMIQIILNNDIFSVKLPTDDTRLWPWVFLKELKFLCPIPIIKFILILCQTLRQKNVCKN